MAGASYTNGMKKIFVNTTNNPPTLKSKDAVGIAYLYAAILVFMVLAQLFTFDNFLIILEDLKLPGGYATAHLVGSLLVACEVLALPFLLRMKLSTLMRVVSMVLGWLVPLFWFKLSIWFLISGGTISNIGLFGTVVKFMPGWPSLMFSVAIGILAAWASWGLWPIKPRKTNK